MEEQAIDLVTRLAREEHPIEICLRPVASVQAFKACYDRGAVVVRFPFTEGGTELCVQVDQSMSNVAKANLTEGNGTVILVGSLEIDRQRVRLIAAIKLETFSGSGRLERCTV